MTNPLSPSELLTVLRVLLPSGFTSLSNPCTALALLAHAIHTSLGFRQVKPSPPAVPDGESTSNDPKERNKLPTSWLERSSAEESFAISYRHDQSSLLFEVRIGRLGGRIVVNAVAVEDDKTATLDINTNDYTSTSAFPKSLNHEAFTLEALFNNPTRLSDYISLYRSQIIQKLIPGLVKPGYTEESNSGGNAPPPSASGTAGPSRPRPGVPYPDPGVGDDRIGAAPQFPQPGRNPLEIGRSDLDPLGGAMGRLPGAGGDGMLVGPGHPLFNRENDPLRMPGRAGGPWGGDGFLPPLGAPPGARFDPVGPFGGPGQQGFPGQRNWGDEMPPPGFDNEMGGGGRFNPMNPGGGNMGGFGGGAFGPPRGGGGGGGFGNMFM